VIGYERDRNAADRQRRPLAPQFHPAGIARQAKTRIIRMLATLLDARLPYIAGCEIRDNPYRPICKRCQDLIEAQGDDTPSPGSPPKNAMSKSWRRRM